ncbi:PREDICTED: uncharacterized protein LOC105558539, partial [Vollenhovia emeryi]|uniref:uncharacterized protein LOC105558539 n=1 Tax=Vollenhovia emeryi TaxID=411798 RepID=UPI0005F44AAD
KLQKQPVYEPTENQIKLNLSIDGLPLAKSSKAQFWPLLGHITHSDYREKPFVIGVFHGYLWRKKIKIVINAVICDAPAKAVIKCIKGHTGYYGCDKCEEEGEWRDNRMLFLNENAPLRTDESFLLRHNEDHHVNDSPIENIALKMVTQFP